jgi:uncharacterized membrane protein
VTKPSAPTTCALPNTTARLEQRGMLWVVGSFLICPCHLPVTMGVLGTLLAGTALGSALSRFPLVAAAVITLTWAVGTVRGFALMRRAARLAASNPSL